MDTHHSKNLGVLVMGLFPLEEHIRVAIFNGVDDGLDDAVVIGLGSHLDLGGCTICRKNRVMAGGQPSHLGVVGVLVQPDEIFVEAQRYEGVGGHGSGGEEEAQRGGLHVGVVIVGLEDRSEGSLLSK